MFSNENSLERFLLIDDEAYKIALSEIKNGKKTSHWMWFFFPQLKHLGKTQTAEIFGIVGLDEARKYLAHPILSARLIEITEAILEHKNKNIKEILDGEDVRKLRSSMTLFALVSEKNSIFHQALDCFYNGQYDEETIKLLNLDNAK